MGEEGKQKDVRRRRWMGCEKGGGGESGVESERGNVCFNCFGGINMPWCLSVCPNVRVSLSVCL